LETATETEAAETSSDAGRVAVNSVGETNVVGAEVPLKTICDDATKLVPATVTSDVGEPTGRVFGDADETEGAGLFTVKFTEFDAPPQGEGLEATTGKVPAAA
jgi:hypothetical protein